MATRLKAQVRRLVGHALLLVLVGNILAGFALHRGEEMMWTTQGVTPHIQKIGGKWRCTGHGRCETGSTPRMAYWKWLASEPRPIYPQPQVPKWIAPDHPPLDYFNRNWMEVMA